MPDVLQFCRPNREKKHMDPNVYVDGGAPPSEHHTRTIKKRCFTCS